MLLPGLRAMWSAALDRGRARSPIPASLVRSGASDAVCGEAATNYLISELLADEDDEHLSFEQLTAYVDGGLPPADRMAVEDHAASCPLCREDLAGLLKVARAPLDMPAVTTIVGATNLAEERSRPSSLASAGGALTLRRYALPAIALGTAAALVLAYVPGAVSPSLPNPRPTERAEASLPAGEVGGGVEQQEVEPRTVPEQVKEIIAPPAAAVSSPEPGSADQAIHSSADGTPSPLPQAAVTELGQLSPESAAGAITDALSGVEDPPRSTASRNRLVSPEASFRQGMEARADGRWSDVVASMREAIIMRPQESTVPIDAGPGLGPVEYFPVFHLGEAYFHLGDCAAALNLFEVSEGQGVIRSRPDLLQTVRSARAACEQKAVRPPAR